MKHVVGALAALGVSLASAQHPHQHGVATPTPKAAGAAAVPAQAPAEGHGSYRSAFSDYRRFAEELPPKDWRKANDEVREAGGHVGLVKGGPAQLQGHGAHGARQPTAPAGDRTK